MTMEPVLLRAGELVLDQPTQADIPLSKPGWPNEFEGESTR